MWKITRLYLKNFIHIYAGISKREVELDFTNVDNKINILIGKMGSGKSSILGHLQPFPTYGTLDPRNQEALIIPEEDGVKEISFIHNGNVYDIRHTYTWNKNSQSHNVKCYIKLNGNELNDNGNLRSFKEIIRTEFGIDQNFLRLLRLGPNVANLINMKSTDRKAFIASLLKDTEIYTMLHQKLTEDYRNMNSALTVLSNKLTGLSSNQENELMVERDTLEVELQELLTTFDKMNAAISKMHGENSILSNKESADDIEAQIELVTVRIVNTKESLLNIRKELDSLPKESLQEISIQFGEVTSKINTIEETLLQYQEKYQRMIASLDKMRDIMLIQSNETQLHILEEKLADIETKYQRSKQELSGFSCKYSYSFLTSFVSTIDNFQYSLEELCTNEKEVLATIYKSDPSIISWAKKRIQSLINLQTMNKNKLNNLQFSHTYQLPHPLYVPPGCPTLQCPFITTHPFTIQVDSKDDYRERLSKIQSDIDTISKKISVYEAYISQYPKMQYLKKSWASVSGVLDDIGALYESNLNKLLFDLNARCNWYNYDRLIAITEKVKMQESFSLLENQYFQIQNEILSIKNSDVLKKKEEYEALESQAQGMLKDIEAMSDVKIELTKKKEELESVMLTMQNIDRLRNEKVGLENDLSSDLEFVEDLKRRLTAIKTNNEKIKHLEGERSIVKIKYNDKLNRSNQIKAQLQDIASTKSSYQEYLDERNILKLILDAVSSKEGIPLVMVRIFLDQCKEIINELISDVFDDDLEIIDFNIKENSNEFKIPYRINGNVVPDIELASQGQQAIISIALSFALCRKSMFDYNIMLLDEIDNSIYKADREKFIMILAKQMQAIGTEQVFLITHNDIFQQSGLPVNIIMTTNEIIDTYPNQTVMKIV